MKVTDINIDLLLYTQPVKTQNYDHDEEGGFFKKLRNKKEEPEVPFFNTRVDEFGRDALYEDIKANCDAYIVRGASFDNIVVLSQNYMILPEKEIFPLYTVKKFAITNELPSNRPYEQYALDRFNDPYDPNYVSEFENEEGFELARFNIRLTITDKYDILYEYVFPMEVADRRDFREKLYERVAPYGAYDYSEEDVMVGEFQVL